MVKILVTYLGSRVSSAEIIGVLWEDISDLDNIY